MLVKPPIEELLPEVENRYVLAMLCAKRARQLVSGARPMTLAEADNDVTLAAYELAEGGVKSVNGIYDERLFVPLRPEIEAKRLEEQELARQKREEALAEEERRPVEAILGSLNEDDDSRVFSNEDSRQFTEQLIQLIHKNVEQDEADKSEEA